MVMREIEAWDQKKTEQERNNDNWTEKTDTRKKPVSKSRYPWNDRGLRN